MNERRSELVERVQKFVEGAFNTGRGFSMMEPPFELEESMARERANEIIALVEQDVARRLLADDVIETMHSQAVYLSGGMSLSNTHIRNIVVYALGVIGIETEASHEQ